MLAYLRVANYFSFHKSGIKQIDGLSTNVLAAVLSTNSCWGTLGLLYRDLLGLRILLELPFYLVFINNTFSSFDCMVSTFRRIIE